MLPLSSKGVAHRARRIRWFLLSLARHRPYTALSDRTLQHSLHIRWAGTALWHPPAIIDFFLYVVISALNLPNRKSAVPLFGSTPFGYWPVSAQWLISNCEWPISASITPLAPVELRSSVAWSTGASSIRSCRCSPDPNRQILFHEVRYSERAKEDRQSLKRKKAE